MESKNEQKEQTIENSINQQDNIQDITEVKDNEVEMKEMNQKDEIKEEPINKSQEKQQLDKQTIISNSIYIYFLVTSIIMLISLLSLQQRITRDETANLQTINLQILQKDIALNTLAQDIEQSSNTINIMINHPDQLLLSNETQLNESLIFTALNNAVNNYVNVRLISNNDDQTISNQLVQQLQDQEVLFVKYPYYIDQPIIVLDNQITYFGVGDNYYKFEDKFLSYDFNAIIQNIFNQASEQYDQQNIELLQNRHNIINPIKVQSKKYFTLNNNNFGQINTQTTFKDAIDYILCNQINQLTIKSITYNIYDQQENKFDLQLLQQIENGKENDTQLQLISSNINSQTKSIIETMNWNYQNEDVSENSISANENYIISGCNIQNIYNKYHICVGIFIGE